MSFEQLFTGKPRVLVIGDVLLDRYVWGEAERLSPEEPVPVLRHKRTQDLPGGAGNTARNLAQLGAEVLLLAAVGRDAAARVLGRIFQRSGLRNPFFVRVSEPTIIKERVMAGPRQLLRLDREEPYHLTAVHERSLLSLLKTMAPRVDGIVISDYAKGTLSPQLIRTAIAIAKRRRIPLVADFKPERRDFFVGATVVTPNLKEAEAMACLKNFSVVEAGRTLVKKLKASVIITEGEEGLTIFTNANRETLHIPAYHPKKIFDVTGAGDTVVAGLAFALARGLPLESAGHVATVAAGIVVGKPGTAAVSREELMAALMPETQKVIERPGLRTLVRDLREREKKIVLAAGCFDLLHRGHLELFESAKKLGDILVVGTNTDASIKKIKGAGRPIIREPERKAMLAALSVVDYVVSFPETTPVELIRRIKPDVFVKGDDWQGKNIPEAAAVKVYGGRAVFIPRRSGVSTTTLITRIRENRGKPRFQV